MKCLVALSLLLALGAVPAGAGIRATYGVSESRPLSILVADAENFAAELSPYRRLIVRRGEAYIVEDRLTGPQVTRVSDLAAIVEQRQRAARGRAPDDEGVALAPRGRVTVNGRPGQGFAMAHTEAPNPERLIAVISDDPALAPLRPVMQRVFEVQNLIEQSEMLEDFTGFGWEQPLLDLLQRGTPLRLWSWTLREVVEAPVDAAAMAIPAEPEDRAALAARLDPDRIEAEDGEALDRQMVSRAIFAGGRLWLLTDSGTLTSLAEGEARRTAHAMRGAVIDICRQDGTVRALTGTRDAGAGWLLEELRGTRWEPVRTIPRAGDAALTLSCSDGAPMLLTSHRLVDLRAEAPSAVRLSEQIHPLVNSVLHVTPEAAFLGLNAGEWGGGLRRIDRRNGRVTEIERNATGGLCDGPLNSACDPVNGIATIPWQPECIAAAVGLIHMDAHGRLTRICPGSVEQLIAIPDEDRVDPAEPRRTAEAATGSFGSVAFFGLAVRGDDLIAVGHNGLYTIDSRLQPVRRRWPRFQEVDGVYVSFELPDVVLVLTQINRRASVSGSSPLLVIR